MRRRRARQNKNRPKPATHQRYIAGNSNPFRLVQPFVNLNIGRK